MLVTFFWCFNEINERIQTCPMNGLCRYTKRWLNWFRAAEKAIFPIVHMHGGHRCTSTVSTCFRDCRPSQMIVYTQALLNLICLVPQILMKSSSNDAISIKGPVGISHGLVWLSLFFFLLLWSLRVSCCFNDLLTTDFVKTYCQLVFASYWSARTDRFLWKVLAISGTQRKLSTMTHPGCNRETLGVCTEGARAFNVKPQTMCIDADVKQWKNVYIKSI